MWRTISDQVAQFVPCTKFSAVINSDSRCFAVATPLVLTAAGTNYGLCTLLFALIFTSRVCAETATTLRERIRVYTRSIVFRI